MNESDKKKRDSLAKVALIKLAETVKKVWWRIVLMMIFIVCIFCVINYFYNKMSEISEPKIDITSTLMEVFDVSTLSAAQFVYGGVATVYEDDTNEDVLCNIKYMANVKAQIDMKRIPHPIIDEENRIIKLKLPEIEIGVYLDEEAGFSFIPAKVDLPMKDILIACKNDAYAEASDSRKLMESARESIKSLIEALIYPIVEQEGYKIEWEQ